MRLARSSILAASLLGASLLAAQGASGAEPGCGRWGLEVSCRTDPSRLVVGDPFKATLTVKNSGDMPLANVSVVLKGESGAHGAAGGPNAVQETIAKLAPGESKEVSGTFACDIVGATRVTGGARDADGFTAANAFCTVDVIGLPAIQSDMSDKDVSGAEKGVFVVGEEFLYVLEVQNDVGSTATPDLKVVFTLPPEIDFVSGSGEPGITVTGAEHGATTSTFALAPNKSVKITIHVKAASRPAGNLVKTTASIQTVAGVELAEEIESTTIK